MALRGVEVARTVPLARRNLFEDRRRALLAVGGIGAGLVMVVLMGAVLVGITAQETAYLERSDADVLVAQRGVRTMRLATSVLPDGTAEAVAAVPGVAWTVPLHQTTTIAEVDAERMITHLYGYDLASGRGGPGPLSEGRPPGPGEVAVDRVGAGTLGLALGDVVVVGGAALRLSGIVDGLGGMGNASMFVGADTFAATFGPDVNWLLVGAAPGTDPAALARTVGEAVAGVDVQTRAEAVAEQARVVEELYAEIFRTMKMIGFLIALALVALTLSTVTAANLREYGVIRSLGGTPRMLAGLVVRQAVWSVLAASVAAVALALLLARLVEVLVPNIVLVVEPHSVLVTVLGALVVGVVAALVPLRRAVRVEPATAFRAAA